MQKLIKPRNTYRQLLEASIGALAVFSLAFVLIPTLILEASALEDVSASVTWQAISLTLDPHGDIDFYDVIPSGRNTASGAYGTQKVIKKQIDVTTEGQYYAVYLSTADTDNSLTVSEDSGRSIPATSNSIASGFAQSSWGYAVPTTETSTTLSAYDAFLANNPGVDTTANNLTKTGTGSSVYNTGKWYGVPGLGSAVQIQRNSTNSVSGFYSGDSFYIYYSIMVDSDVLAGTYENPVLYTAIASTTSIDSISGNIMRDKDTALSMLNELETLEVDLAATNAALTTNDINIYLVPHSIIATNNYDVSSLTATDYPKCATNSIDTTGASSNNISATITCKLPPIGTTGATSNLYEIAQAGEYDFWVIINTPDQQNTISYLSHYRATDENTGTTSDIASITYSTGIGLQTTHTTDGDPNNAEPYIQTMQEMTGTICSNTNMWGSTTGADSRIFDHNGEAKDASSGLTTATPLADTASNSAQIGLGTFLLADVREIVPSGGKNINGTSYKSYLVRRLADGNCWMVQNLALNLKNFAGTQSLTSDNTNLNTKSYWDPSANLRQAHGYANHLGLTDVLEPGPGYDVTGAPSINDYQFQNYLEYGPNLYWGSRYQEGTTIDNIGSTNNNGLVIASNSNIAFARSYDGGLTYLPGTSTTKDYERCVATTSAQADFNAGCDMPGNKAEDFGSINLLSQTSIKFTNTGSASIYSTTTGGLDITWQPETVSDATDSAFTMRGSMYIGDYYNYYAATAETDRLATGYVKASDDICPKGWQLPNEDSSDGGWINLINVAYGISTPSGYNQASRIAGTIAKTLPLSLPNLGYYARFDGELINRGRLGRWWSGANHDKNEAYFLSIGHGGDFSIKNSHFPKDFGFSVRCVARD